MSGRIAVATWDSGLFTIEGTTIGRELPGRSIRALSVDRRGRSLAVVDGDSLYRRAPGDEWDELAKSEFVLSCCVAIGDDVFIGTSDAHVLHLDRDGSLARLAGFDRVDGRDTWYAGTAVVDGRVVGPPLGIRSIAATCDDAVLLANVHVGGIPRSTDGGRSWHATIDVESDVHQVCAHPSRPELVVAASAIGLCVSRDAGATWTIESRGLHAPHCSAVAFGKNDVFVSASVDPFAPHGAVYRRAIDDDGPLRVVSGAGMPQWTDGRVDTACIATRDESIAMVDGGGRLYVSHDDGASWRSPSERFSMPSGLQFVEFDRARRA